MECDPGHARRLREGVSPCLFLVPPVVFFFFLSQASPPSFPFSHRGGRRLLGRGRGRGRRFLRRGLFCGFRFFFLLGDRGGVIRQQALQVALFRHCLCGVGPGRGEGEGEGLGTVDDRGNDEIGWKGQHGRSAHALSHPPDPCASHSLGTFLPLIPISLRHSQHSAGWTRQGGG